MSRVLGAVVLAVLAVSSRASAQSAGTIAGTVRDADNGLPVGEVLVEVEGAQRRAITDSLGEFRLRSVRAGWHRVRALRVGYRPAARDSVLVRAGETVTLELLLAPRGLDTLQAIDVVTAPDIVLDPMVPATVQRITGDDLRQLPVSSLEDAVQLSAGVVGGSYRGGRTGQEAFVLDGLTVKNQLDASTGELGLRFPPDMLTEAAVVTNGFSARYGQVLSGLINVVTKDGGERWSGRFAYENDRPLPESGDYGLDRVVVAADGPLLGARLALALDATGRLDADPVAAPPPPEPRDPRSRRANLLPHNGGELYSLAGKITLPVGRGHLVRLLGLGTVDQRQLFDPALKYDLEWAPARRTAGRLLSAHWQYATTSRAARSFVGDLRVSHFSRDFVRGVEDGSREPAFGAFTFRRLRVVGEELARSRDTAAAALPIPGYAAPQPSDNSPWGVPAFFVGAGGRGELAWNRFGELRGQLDLDFGGRDADLFVGGELVRQSVETFQRVEAFAPAGGAVPPATTSSFSPLTAALYGEGQVRLDDLALTVGVRYDRFDPRTTVGGTQTRARSAVSPRLAVSTVLRGATVVVSYGRFAQAPDFQYLVDAAFDDTTRTGRFRTGNPALGYETATQYEFSLRMRPSPGIALRINAFRRRLDGLVASIPLGFDPDSAIFGNDDFGTVTGAELLYEREFSGSWGLRVSYSLQKAEATSTDAFRLFRLLRIAPNGIDTIVPSELEFPLDYDRRHGLTVIAQARVPDRGSPRFVTAGPLAGLEAAGIVRWNSGLPYTRTNAAGDSILDGPNAYRLPSNMTVDLLLRRPFALGGLRASVYVDVRNLLGRRNVVAVRRDTGMPGLGESGLQAAADSALQAHPQPIPYESQRYRRWADLDGNGLIEGAELPPLFLAAARDYFQPLFAYGAPRLVRLGLEVIF